MNKPYQTTAADMYYNNEGSCDLHEITKIPHLLTAKEVSEILKIGYTKTLELMRYGKIPCIKLGNTYRTSEEALAEWIQQSLKQS